MPNLKWGGAYHNFWLSESRLKLPGVWNQTGWTERLPSGGAILSQWTRWFVTYEEGWEPPWHPHPSPTGRTISRKKQQCGCRQRHRLTISVTVCEQKRWLWKLVFLWWLFLLRWTAEDGWAGLCKYVPWGGKLAVVVCRREKWLD